MFNIKRFIKKKKNKETIKLEGFINWFEKNQLGRVVLDGKDMIIYTNSENIYIPMDIINYLNTITIKKRG